MNAFIEHVDTEQQLQFVALICLEISKCFVCIRVVRIGFIHCHNRIYLCKPFRHMRNHFVHVLLVCAKYDVFSAGLRDMMLEDKIKSICLLQGTTQSLQILLVYILNTRYPQIVHSCLVICENFLILINGRYIFWCRQNTPDDCFAKGNLARNMPIKKFFSHIAVIVQITNIGCR
jgi:hypothetical protein